MLELIEENVDPTIVEDVGHAWTARNGFRKIKERIATTLKDGKNSLILYESIPLIFSHNILEPLMKLLEDEFPDITTQYKEVSSIAEFYDEVEEYFNNRGNRRFVLTCNKENFNLIMEDSLGPVLIAFFDVIDKVSGLIKFNDYIDYMKLTEQFPSGLNNENSEFVNRNFDFSKLVFFTCLASFAKTFEMDLDDVVSLIKKLTYTKINNTDILIPCAEHLMNRKIYNLFLRTLKKETIVPLDFLAHQSLLSIEDYVNILISVYLLKKLSREKVTANLATLSVYYSPDYYRRIKRIVSSQFSAKTTWFVLRLLLEAFMSHGVPPEIKDYEIRYHLWPVYPAKDTTQEKEFQDQVLEVAQRLSISASRSQFAQLGYGLLNEQTSYMLDPLFASPDRFDESGLAQAELKSLLASAAEIVEATERRWLLSEKAAEENGGILLKIQSIINMVCILDFVYGSVLLKQQISEFADRFNSLIAKADAEHIALESLKLLSERGKLLGTFHRNETLSKNIDTLEEAVRAYEQIKEIDIQKIENFFDIWSMFFHRDILSQRKGIEINVKLWNTLSKKYHALNTSLMNEYPLHVSRQRRQSQVLHYVSDLISKRKVVFLLIVDSFSFPDWFFVKKKLDNRFVVMEETPLCAVFPTETSVGHAAIFSSMDPLENGVFSRVLYTAQGDRWEIMEVAAEGDTLSKIPGSDSNFRSELCKVLVSANMGKKCLVVSPFKKTRLTTVLKCLITEENARWIENEFDWEKTQFEHVVDWIYATICSRKREELLDYGTIIILFPNFDERGHGGKKDWDTTVYFAKLEEELIHILNGIAETIRDNDLEASIIITSDHGKMFRWEAAQIERSLGKNFADFNEARKEIIKSCVKYVREGREPVTSAKYLLIWVNANEKQDLIGQIEKILNGKQGVVLIDEFEKVFGCAKNSEIVPPSMAVASMYSYIGPGLFQHSGISLEELIIPYIRLDLNFNV